MYRNFIAVCDKGVWQFAQWDNFCVGVYVAGQWRNLGSFEAYVYEFEGVQTTGPI